MALTGKIFEVHPPLSDVVKHFYALQTPNQDETQIAHLSPNYEMMLLFNFGKPFHISFAGDAIEDDLIIGKVALLGPLRKMLNYEVPGGTDFIATIFNLDGFYRLFQIPMDNLDSEKIHPVDEKYQHLWDTLQGISALTDRIQILSDYILSVMQAPDEASLPLHNGASYFNDPLIQPAKAIAADADLSERTIQTRFKKYVGYSPKEMLRFLRFKQVINSIEQNPHPEIDWFDLIHDFGYHDQSHLIKDFQHFLGTSPQAFIKQIIGKEFCTTKPGKNYS
jgi:AraC-like DNA-binding protein